MLGIWAYAENINVIIYLIYLSNYLWSFSCVCKLNVSLLIPGWLSYLCSIYICGVWSPHCNFTLDMQFFFHSCFMRYHRSQVSYIVMLSIIFVYCMCRVKKKKKRKKGWLSFVGCDFTYPHVQYFLAVYFLVCVWSHCCSLSDAVMISQDLGCETVQTFFTSMWENFWRNSQAVLPLGKNKQKKHTKGFLVYIMYNPDFKKDGMFCTM